MTTIDKSKPVLVTGANGYVASWLVKKLDVFELNSRNFRLVGHRFIPGHVMIVTLISAYYAKLRG